MRAKEISKRLRKGRKKTMKILDLFRFLKRPSNHGRIAAELPTNNVLWETQAWINFMAKHNLKYVYFDGCALGLQGKQQKFFKRPHCVATNNLRILQYFGQLVCPGNHEHEPAQDATSASHTHMSSQMFCSRHGIRDRL